MSLPDSTWRIPSRPCPFYQRGNCIFAAQCNFLHTLPEKRFNDEDSLRSSRKSSRDSLDYVYSAQKLPIVRVDSPSSMKSPPREPQMERLLSALTEVIGDDSEEEEEEDEVYNESMTLTEPDDATAWSSGLPTLVHGGDATFFARVTDAMTEMMRLTDGEDDESEDDDFDNSAFHPAKNDDDDNTLKLPCQDDTPSIHTTHSSPDAQYIEMPAIPDNHNDLLSPVDLSQVHLTNFSFDDTDDTDSGFEDAWKSPLSPPRSPGNHTSTFNLLHSPFGSPSARVLSPRIGALLGRSPSLPLDRLPGEPKLQDDLDSPSTRISAPEDPAARHEDTVRPAFQELEADDPLPDNDDEDEAASSRNGSVVVVSQELESAAESLFLDTDVSADFSLYAEDDSGSEGDDATDPSIFQLVTRDDDTSPLGAYLGDSEGSTSPSGMDEEDADGAIRNRVAFASPEEPLPFSENDEVEDASDGSESYGHTSVWGPAEAETPVFVGSAQSPASIEVPNELNRQSMQLLEQPPLDEDAPVWDEADAPDSPAQVSPDSDYGVLAEEGRQAMSPMSIGGNGRALESNSPPSNPGASTSTPPQNPAPSPEQYLDSEDDSTAYLGYLQNETEEEPEEEPEEAANQDGDTLHSLYDAYTDLTPSPKALSPAESTKPLRERVFTPPPLSASHLGRLGSYSTASSSPVPSLDSLPKGRASPVSVASSSKHVHDEPQISKKVPFGFRHQRHSTRPSLTLNGGRSLSRLGTQHSAGLEDPVDRPNSTPPSSACSTSALRPLRLSVLLNSQSNSNQSLSLNQPLSATPHTSLSSVPSRNSLSTSRSLSSAPATAYPYHSHSLPTGLIDSRPPRSPSLLTDDFNYLATFGSPISAPVAGHPSWPSLISPHASHFSQIRSASRLSEPIYEQEGEDDTFRQDSRDEPIRRAIDTTAAAASSHTAPHSRADSEMQMRDPMHSIATPKPTLMFAIASDDVAQVRQVLESGDANPNDTVGPQSALQFALTNDQLTNKLEIVKTLLAFGADPSHLVDRKEGAESQAGEGEGAAEVQPHQMSKSLMEGMDPATRYYVERADAAHTRKTSSLIHRSFFRPLTRVRYDLVGQDRALEELFKLLSIHSRQISVSPVVVMFSGPSGHGKSLLARKFGSLLDVPTHTVNMVSVRSQDDLWESYSINPHEEPTNCTLAEFLVNNEGKRCVVVLDEIEKVDNEKVLWSLLMPWESGRCSFEAKSRHVDVRNVIWLCTSNIGQGLIFDHWNARENPSEMLTRPEFLELVALLRPRVSERLGASVLSRITSVLPFVPFTQDEKQAVCAEAIYQLGGEDAMGLSMETIGALIEGALKSYIPEEGARSLHRAVSNQLVDVI
ncbi:hypothetical protein D9611_013369 [Ephemerocybe angulata]|uniref:C3H1-type domain-containing protein n=1 Tax=Ephemerocybe angulata TaxID=980116 RepID=A0A8H5FJ45_9AGAR|nr:hypothetical protein D9611_013369 [Tulosesus angulatus]